MWGLGLAESDEVTFFAALPVSWLPEDKTTRNFRIFSVIQCVPVKTSNIFRIGRTRLRDQGFPHAIFLQVTEICKF